MILQLLDELVAPLYPHSTDDVGIRFVLLPTDDANVARLLLICCDLNAGLADRSVVDRDGVLAKTVEHIVGNGDHRRLHGVLVQFLAAELQLDLRARLAVYPSAESVNRTEEREVHNALLDVFLHALVLLAEIDDALGEIRHHVDEGLGHSLT